jgi:SulP family sulfate permease
LFLTGPLAYMPAAVLSAVVFLICMDLIDVKGMCRIYRERPWEFWVALITAATVVFVGVEEGILLAMFLSLLSHTRHGYQPKNALIVMAEPEGWKTVPVATQAQLLPGLMLYRFSHGMYYANATVLSQEVTTLVNEAQPPLTWFAVDASAIDDIDFSAAETLRSLHAMLKQRGIKLVFSELSADVKAELDRSGIIDLLGADAFFTTAIEMMKAYQATPK